MRFGPVTSQERNGGQFLRTKRPGKKAGAANSAPDKTGDLWRNQAALCVDVFDTISVEPFGAGTRMGNGTRREEEVNWFNVSITFSTWIRCTDRWTPVAEWPVQYTRARSCRLFLYACPQPPSGIAAGANAGGHRYGVVESIGGHQRHRCCKCNSVRPVREGWRSRSTHASLSHE